MDEVEKDRLNYVSSILSIGRQVEDEGFHYGKWSHHFSNTRWWYENHKHIIDNCKYIRVNEYCSSKSALVFCLSFKCAKFNILGYNQGSDTQMDVYASRETVPGVYFVFYFDFNDRYGHTNIGIVSQLPHITPLYRDENGILYSNVGSMTKASR